MLDLLHILDLFAGSGTTLLAAALKGYTATGIEVTPDYARLSRERIARELREAEEKFSAA